MAITLAGVELLSSIPEVDAWIDANISFRDVLADTRLYFPTAFTTNFVWPGWADRPIKPGALFWPAGASRPAVGHYLADQAILDELQPLMAPTAGGLTSATLKITQVDAEDGTTVGTVEATVYLLPPRPLSGFAAVDDVTTPTEQLFLLTVVDRRFFLFMQNTGALTDTTWATLLTSIAANVSPAVTLTVDTPSADYSTPPAALQVKYENAAVFLDGVAYSVGQRIVFGLTGSATSQSSANAATAAAANLALSDTPLAGGAYAEDFINNSVPATAKVVYPPSTSGAGYLQQTGTVNALGYAIPPTYHHSLQYTGSNATTLQTCTDRLCTDLAVWLKPVCDVVFAGIVAATPNGLQDIEWTHRLKRTTLDLPEDMVDKDPTYEDLGELDDEAAWYDSEVTTRVSQAPFLDFAVAGQVAAYTAQPSQPPVLDDGCHDDCPIYPEPQKLLLLDEGVRLPQRTIINFTGTPVTATDDTTNQRTNVTVTLSSSTLPASTGSWWQNLLINGGFDYAQRQTPGTLTTIADQAYGPDRWKMERSNAGLQYQRLDGTAETSISSNWYGRFKKTTSAGTWIAYQWVLGQNSFPMRGQSAYYVVWLKSNAIRNIKASIVVLGSGGTINTIPSPLVTSWGPFSMGANVTMANGSGSGDTLAVSTSWTGFGGSAIGLSTSLLNIGFAIWTEDNFAADDTLDVAMVQMGLGDGVSAVRTWMERHAQQELALCRHFYRKSFNVDTAPAQNVGAATGETSFGAFTAGAAQQRSQRIEFDTPMWGAPTVTTYNPAAANAEVRDETAGADCSAVAANDVEQTGFDISATGNAGTAVGNKLGIHWSAVKEL